METNPARGHLAALLTIVIWGTTFISTKVLLVDFQPVEILFIRFMMGFLALLAVCPRRLQGVTRRQEGLFALAGLCGVFLGGALYRVPVLMDGFISAVAALCALRLCPAVGAAVFASHVSAEPGHSAVLRALGKTPLIAAQMRLGEGTGAVAAMPLLDMALAVYRGTTFDVYGIPAYVPQEGAQ